MTHTFRRPPGKRGQTLVEYAMILAFISIVAIAVLISFGQNVKGVYTRVDSSVASGQANH